MTKQKNQLTVLCPTCGKKGQTDTKGKSTISYLCHKCKSQSALHLCQDCHEPCGLWKDENGNKQV
jgi:predicted RNA-binding Zn-ribbon protein involved in translation (DUF1610 family)